MHPYEPSVQVHRLEFDVTPDGFNARVWTRTERVIDGDPVQTLVMIECANGQLLVDGQPASSAGVAAPPQLDRSCIGFMGVTDLSGNDVDMHERSSGDFVEDVQRDEP
jgi:hypothetical protein